MRQPLRSDDDLASAMRQFGDAVYRVALAQTGSPADAEDVYQDVFLRLLKDSTDFTDGEHMKAWLLRVAINRCHDLQRSGWRRRTGPLERDHASLEAPASFRSDIWDVVGNLPEDLRAVVHLFYVEGYATDEIARIVQCKPSTVRTRLFRAREQLRDDVNRAENHPPRKEGSHECEQPERSPERRKPAGESEPDNRTESRAHPFARALPRCDERRESPSPSA